MPRGPVVSLSDIAVQDIYSMYGTHGGCDNRGGNTVQKWAWDNAVGGPNSPPYGVVFFKNVMKSDDPAKWGKMWGPFKGDAKVGGVLKVNNVGREANDEFSALCVAPNTRAQIWDHADFKGDFMIFEGVNTAAPRTAGEPKGYFCFNLSKVPDCPNKDVYNGFNDRTTSFVVTGLRYGQADSENQLVDEDGEGQSAPEVELSALLEGLPAEEGYVAGTEGGEELSEEAEEAEGPSDLL